MSGYIPVSEQRKLISKSGNRCAICKNILVDVKNANPACIGEAAHIFGEKPGAARYDKTQDINYVNSEANLIFICRNCHAIIDDKNNNYSTEKLFEIKKQHEYEVVNEIDKLPTKQLYTPVENFLAREVVPFEDFQKGETHLYFHKELRCSLFDACIKNKRVVLLGEAGSGKSIVLKQLAADISLDEENNLFPILYDLRFYTDEEIEEIIHMTYSEIAMDRVFLILDAYDEIEEQKQNHFARKLNTFAKKYPHTFTVISTRNNFYTCADQDGYGSKFEGFAEYSLCSLTSKQIQQYVSGNGLSWESFSKEIYLRKINDLINNPFYLVELVKLHVLYGKLPEKSELMEMIILSRFEKDTRKYVTTKNISSYKRDIMISLQKIAFAMQCMHKIDITEDEYQQLLGVDERKLLNYSGIFSKVEGDKYQFEHNNFREYLVAKYLCNADLGTIKDLLCTPDGAIKHSWMNVLSYLVLIYNNSDLLSWLCEIGTEFIIKFEHNRLNEDDRSHIAIQIIDSVSKRNMWLSRTSVSFEELTEFGQSAILCEYLLKQIKNPLNFRCQANCIHVLSNFSEKYGMDDEIREVLFECIKSDKTRDYEKRNAIEAIAELELATPTITKYLLLEYDKSNSSIFVNGFINYLLSLPSKEDYIDIYIKEYTENHHHSKEFSSSTYFEIKNFFENIHEYSTLTKLLIHFSHTHKHYSFENEVYDSLIQKAINEYLRGNKNIFNVMLEAIEATERRYNSAFRECCKKFFTETKTLKTAFITLASKYSESDRDLLFLLESLDVDGCYETLLNDTNKYINLIIDLYRRMTDNHPLLDRYKNAIQTAGREVPEPKHIIDYAAEREKATQIYFDSLFSKDDFSELINYLLQYIEKPELTYKELSEIHKRDFDDIAKGELFFYLSIDLQKNNYQSPKVKDFVLEINWDDFSMYALNRLMETHHKIKISDEQKSFFKKICKKTITIIDEWDTDNKKITYNMVYIMFFSSYFDFCYPKETFLKMLFIPKEFYERSNPKPNCAFSDYLNKHLTDYDIKNWMISNAKPGNLHKEVAEDCITYCENNNLNYAIELAEDFCKNSKSEWLKRKSTEYIIQILGYKYLYENHLNNCDEDMLKSIVDFTIKHQDTQLIEKLEEVNRKSKDPLKYLSELISLNSSYGLKKYYQLAKKRKTLPDYTSSEGISSITEKIAGISKIEHIPILSKLQTLLFSQGFVDKDAFGLWNSLHNAFRKIAGNDFEAVKKHLLSSLQHCNPSDEEACFCNSILEEISSDQNTTNDVAWGINDVIRFIKIQQD